MSRFSILVYNATLQQLMHQPSKLLRFAMDFNSCDNYKTLRMKRLLSLIALFTISLNLAVAQKKNREYNIGGGVVVSPDKNGAGGFEVLGEILNDKNRKYNSGISLGLGILFPMSSPVLGDNYNGIIAEVDRADLRERGIKKDVGIYLSAGYTFWRITLGGRIGIYESRYYERGFNSIMGIHHITRHNGDHFMGGGYANIKATKWMGISAGYDNYTKFNIGVNFRYTLR